MTELALDIGQTQTRVRAIADDGAVRELELDGFRYGGSVVDSLFERCMEAARTLGMTSVDAIAAGVTGMYGKAPDISGLHRSLRKALGTRRLIVADDAVTSHLGALGGEGGTLVAAGTGIVGLGIGPVGPARVDGVGSLIGDDGSGWWIGRRGIIAALSAFDGRSEASGPLLDALQEVYGPADGVAALVARSPFPVGLVASFAPAVAEAARAGDRVAAAIWTEAARHIADVVVAASARAGFERDSRFVWGVTGRLTGAADLLDPVLNGVVVERFPAASRAEPVGTALDGSARLFHDSRATLLAPLVGVSDLEEGPR